MEGETNNRCLHNVVFALIIGTILGATLWSIHSREPFVAAPSLEVKYGDDKSVPMTKGKIEKMVEQGLLSKHPAMYYRKVDK